MRKCKIEQEHQFSEEDISDLLVTAFEGGINYWCGKVISILNKDKTYAGVSAEDQSKIIYQSDVISYGGTLKLFDVERSDGPWDLTQEKMLTGIEKYCSQNNINLKDLMDDYDADTADSIVQIACMGEITFG